MMRWRIKRTDWIMSIILMLLAVVGYYFGVIGPAPGLGGYVARLGLARAECTRECPPDGSVK